MITFAVFTLAIGVISIYFLGSTTHRPNLADYFGSTAFLTGYCLLLLATLEAVI